MGLYKDSNKLLKQSAAVKDGQAYVVRLPVYDDKKLSLAQLWEKNEFPIINRHGNLTNWRMYELPYRLKTGRSLQQDLRKYYQEEILKHIKSKLQPIRPDISNPNFIAAENKLLEMKSITGLPFKSQKDAMKDFPKTSYDIIESAVSEYNENIDAIYDIASRTPEGITLGDVHKLYDYGLISQKQMVSAERAIQKGQLDKAYKYLNFQNLEKKATNLYYNRIRINKNEKYKDAVLSANREYLNSTDNIEDFMHKAGVEPSFEKTGPNGEMIFTTEGISQPANKKGEIRGLHYSIVDKRDKKILNIVDEFTDVTNRKGHGHHGKSSGKYSRNLGAVIPGIIGTYLQNNNKSKKR